MPQSFVLDRTGFPMIWVDAIRAYVHWLPITKIQFEYFLCSPSMPFDALWYDQVCGLNPRVSPSRIQLDNYWQVFMTGVKPNEARLFATWMSRDNDDYHLPTEHEWLDIHAAMSAAPRMSIGDMLQVVTLDRQKKLLSKISDIRGESRSAARQMMIGQDMAEWIAVTNKGWDLIGRPNRNLGGSLKGETEQHYINKPEEQRIKYAGFRLIRRSSQA